MYRKLPAEAKIIAEKKEKVFRQSPFNPILKTHKLSGKLVNYWFFSINYQYRIIFSFLDNDIVRFHMVGIHEIYG